MAQKAKFSISVKPRARDQFLGTGIVFVSAYLDWLADLADAYLEKVGVVAPPNTMLTTLRHELTYHSPLLISEEAKVSLRTIRLGRSSFTNETQITEAKTGRPIVTVITVGLWMNPQTGRSVPIPEDGKQNVIAFEGKENVELA